MSAEERKLSGESAPKGIGYGIGLAFALFIMQGRSFCKCRSPFG